MQRVKASHYLPPLQKIGLWLTFLPDARKIDMGLFAAAVEKFLDAISVTIGSPSRISSFP